MIDFRLRYFFGDAGKLWFVFIAAGLFAFISPYILELNVTVARTIVIGASFITIGILLRSFFFGIQIDPSRKRFRYYSSYLWIKVGNWMDLPPLQKVVHTSKKVTFWNTPNGVSPTFRGRATIYTIGLFSSKNQPDIIIQAEKLSTIKRMLEKLTDQFQVDVETI